MNNAIYNALMSQQITVQKIGLDVHGQQGIQDSWTESGFIEYGGGRTVDENGEDISYDARCFLNNESHFDPSHKRWAIVDSDYSQQLEMVNFDVCKDPRNNKLHHYEIYLA